MHKKTVLICTSVLLFSLILAACKPADANQSSPQMEPGEEVQPAVNASEIEEPSPEPVEPTPEPESADAGSEMLLFETDDGVFHMSYPSGWATNQVPVENGLAFGIAPLPEYFSAGSSMFNEPIIMVYGSVNQVSPELAIKENVENFHVSNFYSNNSNFSYTLIGQPTVTTPSSYIIYYITQAESQLSTGVLTNWMLGTAIADQTVITFAVGLPVDAMEQYGQLAMEMFNSIEIDTEVTAQLVK